MNTQTDGCFRPLTPAGLSSSPDRHISTHDIPHLCCCPHLPYLALFSFSSSISLLSNLLTPIDSNPVFQKNSNKSAYHVSAHENVDSTITAFDIQFPPSQCFSLPHLMRNISPGVEGKGCMFSITISINQILRAGHTQYGGGNDTSKHLNINGLC